MTSPAFALMASVTASTKRAPALVDGKRGEPVVNLTGLKITPPDPVNAELRERFALGTPHEVLQSFHESADPIDIKEGDILVTVSNEYPIRAVEDYDYGEDYYIRMILEDLKN